MSQRSPISAYLLDVLKSFSILICEMFGLFEQFPYLAIINVDTAGFSVLVSTLTAENLTLVKPLSLILVSTFILYRAQFVSRISVTATAWWFLMPVSIMLYREVFFSIVNNVWLWICEPFSIQNSVPMTANNKNHLKNSALTLLWANLFHAFATSFGQLWRIAIYMGLQIILQMDK